MRGRWLSSMMLIVVALTSLGLLMVFSSSLVTTASSYDFGRDPFFFVKRQGIYLAISLVAFFVVSRLPLDTIRKNYLLVGYWVVFALLALVLFIGPEINGARRWIIIAGFQFQPAELAKILTILLAADGLSRLRDNIKNLALVFPLMLYIGLLVVLVEREPDLGTALIIATVFMAMLHVSGIPKRYTFALFSFSSIAVVLMIVAKPYRMQRILTFLDPFKDAQGSGYQPVQSMLALGSGGLSGVGFGSSHQKFKYLPEAHTDYIFSILGEELGFLGSVSVIALFLMFFYLGMKLALKCKSSFHALIVFGFSFQITLQALLNIGVVIGALPSTGLPLPFISYGGTSLLISFISLGFIINATRQDNLLRLRLKKRAKIRRASSESYSWKETPSKERPKVEAWEQQVVLERWGKASRTKRKRASLELSYLYRSDSFPAVRQKVSEKDSIKRLKRKRKRKTHG